MDSLTDRIANLPREKRVLLELRLKRRSLTAPSVEQVIPRRADSGPAPLSFAQQRLWFLEQLEPGTAVYNLPGAYRLKGPLDIKSLQNSLNEIVRRHEALRTTFRSVDGSPVQVVNPESPLSLPVVDLSDRPEGERESEARRIADEESQQPFDLAQGPLMRAMLLRLDEDNHILLLTMHHIVSDGWSMGILARELSTSYEAFHRSVPAPLSDLPIQYADYAIWQREWLQGAVLQTQLAYWRQQLKNFSPLQLPTDRPRPRVQSYRGARQSLTISKELADELKTMSGREGVTLFMTLLAAFQVLLHRYSGQDDIVVGSPIAGRNRFDIEPLIGFFVNTLVFRSDLSGNPTFRELLGRVREMAFGAYAHQDVPFEKLVEELQPQRNLSHSPLFQVTFQLQNAPRTPLRFDGLTVSRFQLNRWTAKFDLSLTIHEASQGLGASLRYNTALFDACSIDRILGHFQTLLQGLVTNPERRISDLPILSEDERHQLLVKWNDTARDYPKHKCIHELFEEQVERTPDATALIFPSVEPGHVEGQQLTYRELNQRANQVAHYLRKSGVGPEVLVGICIERSLEMVVALLGILKASATYVPLDPEYPKERLAYMLEDTQAPILLTQKSLLGTFLETISSDESITPIQNRKSKIANLVCLDRDWDEITKESTDNPENQATPENLAYVIYTSGSTGQPKGVQIPHGAVVNFLCSMRQQPGLTDRDTVLALTTLSFDIAGLELYLPLMVGARVIIANREIPADGAWLAKQLTDFAVTMMQATPVTWQMLVEAGWQNKNDSKILCGGEALPNELSNRLLTRSSSLWNMYGPTETTIWSALSRIKLGQGPLSVGRPIANTRVYILDRRLKPVPVGVPGELYIGGTGLSRGYLHQPELTAQSFLPDPFSLEPGTRLYKTGDLARYLPDGNIQVLGRVDSQVKVRGFRIELGEIEATLRQHPAVREAVVLVRQEIEAGAGETSIADGGGENPESKTGNSASDRRLAAYVVCRSGATVAVDELRRLMKSKLPEYMLPSVFVLLDSLPLTPNGKVDRKALPLPHASNLNTERTYIGPRDDIERKLTTVWESLLGTHPIGIKDNFFELGGHSLLAVKLMAEVEKITGRKLPVVILFRAPTIEQLANISRLNLSSINYSSLVPIHPSGSKPPLFLVHGGDGSVLYYSDLARHMDPDQPLYALQSPGIDGDREPLTELESMAAHYVNEIRKVRPEGPYLLAGLCMGGAAVFEMAQQLCAQGQNVALLALIEAYLSTPKTVLSYSVRRVKHKLKDHVVKRFVHHQRNLKNLSRGEWPKYLLEKMKVARGRIIAGLSLNQTRLNHRAKVKRANTAAKRSYQPTPYPGRVTLFVAQDLPIKPRNDRRLAWGELATGGVEVHTVPGNHDSVIWGPNAQGLAAMLIACIAKALSTDAS